MAEVTCSTCGGDGLCLTPHPVLDMNENPAIEIRISMCSTCSGMGKVER